MSVSSIAEFLQNMASADLEAFGQRLTLSEWKILWALGKSTHINTPTPGSGQSYKALKCLCALSDDGLSRALRRLVELGLIVRRNSDADQRVTHYRLSSAGQDGMLRMERVVLEQLGQLVIALSVSQAESGRGLGLMQGATSSPLPIGAPLR